MAASVSLACTHEPNPPDYRNSFDESAHVLLKPELSNPTTQWPHRQWYQIVLQLQGTQILLRQKSGLLLCDRPLSLQGAQVGLATDYHKKTFVFRMRVEGYQFLCATASFAATISWVDVLNAAIDVSADLDEREEPTYKTMANGRAPLLRSLSVHTDGASEFQRIWRRMRSRSKCTWLREQFSEHRGLELERYLEEEAQVLANRSASPRPKAQCSCSSCYNATCAVRSLDTNQFPTTKVDRKLDHMVSCDRKELIDTTTSQIDRVRLARGRLECASRCAKTLTFRASWRKTRYLRGRRWVEISGKVSRPGIALSG